MNLEFLNIGWTWFANDHIVFLFDTTSQLHWNWVRPQNTFGTFRDWCSTCTCKVCFLCIPLRWDIQKYNCWQQCLNNYLVNLEAEITSAYLQGCYKNWFQRVLFFFFYVVFVFFGQLFFQFSSSLALKEGIKYCSWLHFVSAVVVFEVLCKWNWFEFILYMHHRTSAFNIS